MAEEMTGEPEAEKIKVEVTESEEIIPEAEEAEIEEKEEEITPKVIKELRERLESLENLIMVEEVARVELKKALEELILPKLPVEVEEFKNKIRELETFKSEAVDLLKALDEKVGRVTEVPSRVVNDIELLKRNIDSFEKRIVELEKAPEKILEESRKNLSEIKEKIDDLEKRIILLKDVKTFEERMEKFDVAIKELKNGLEISANRINELEKIKPRIIDLSKNIELIKTTLDTTLKSFEEKIKGVEPPSKKIEEIKKNISDLSKDIETLKSGLGENTHRIAKLEISIKETDEIKKSINSLIKDLEENSNRLRFIEEQMEKIDGIIKEAGKIKPEIASLSKEIELLKGSLSESVKRIGELEKVKLMESEKSLKEISKRFDKIESEVKRVIEEVKNLKPEEVKKIINVITTESKKSADELRAIAHSTISPLDSQIKSLSERMILLETRVSALEKLFREKTQAPVIIE